MGDRGRELARKSYGRVELADRALAVLEEAAEGRAPHRGRRAVWWGVAATAALLALAFAPTFRTLWRTWLHNDNYSHGLLIPLVSGFLLWRHRRALRASVGRPSAWGLPVLAAGLLALVAGTRADFTMVQGYSFVIVLLGLVLHFFGRATARQALFPVAYLIFMSPLPPVLANDISFRLKAWVVNFSTAAARWMGIAVAREGMTLHLPTGAVAIENPCSGLRSLVAVLALATLLAYFARRGGMVRRVALVLSAVPIALAANWVRITLIVLAANYVSVAFATGAMHDISGYVLFGVDVIGLLLVRAALRC